MKRLIPIFATAVLACAISTDALAREKSKRRLSAKKYRVEQRVERIRPGVTQEWLRAVTPSRVIAVPTASMLVEERTPEGADTSGVARSTGAGIGEWSTRSDVGTGRGGAGIVRSGTLAPSAALPSTTIVTTVPAATTTIGGVILAPEIPRATTNTGTIGAGSSTFVGVAPGR